jgi:hypothetical protein
VANPTIGKIFMLPNWSKIGAILLGIFALIFGGRSLARNPARIWQQAGLNHAECLNEYFFPHAGHFAANMTELLDRPKIRRG